MLFQLLFLLEADNNVEEKENQKGFDKYSFISYNPQVLESMFQKLKAKQKPVLLDKLTQLHPQDKRLNERARKSIFNSKNLKLYFGDNESIKQWFKLNVVGKNKEVETLNKSNSVEP